MTWSGRDSVRVETIINACDAEALASIIGASSECEGSEVSTLGIIIKKILEGTTPDVKLTPRSERDAIVQNSIRELLSNCEWDDGRIRVTSVPSFSRCEESFACLSGSFGNSVTEWLNIIV